MQEWHYCSVVGQMNYLAGTTRPDIIFDVYQCVKYSIYPKQYHKEAVKSIGRYLKKTIYKVLVSTSGQSNGLECYADEDFYGSWYREYADQFGSVLSRTGYMIIFSNCLIVWVIKIKTEIDSSKTEAEYSQRMRDLISLRLIMLEVSSVFGMKCDLFSSYKTTLNTIKEQ